MKMKRFFFSSSRVSNFSYAMNCNNSDTNARGFCNNRFLISNAIGTQQPTLYIVDSKRQLLYTCFDFRSKIPHCGKHYTPKNFR